MALNERQVAFKGWIKRQYFDKSGVLKFEDLETKARGLASVLYPDLTFLEVGEVLQELTLENNVEMALGDSIVDKATFKSWIGPRRSTTETPRWNAYRNLLINRDWEENVIKTLDKMTDEVVELLGDPLQVDGIWPRRGLLMGEVQSGKTATYLGVLNKALDFGYRVIVVIGGHTEDLRQQTQARFDTDLIGIDSETWEDGISGDAIRYVGVGLDSEHRAHLMTTVRHDFSKSKRGSSITWVDGEIPTVFVTKKTPSLLDNIRTYIKSQAAGGRLNIPLIVVDDESDWGSPNTNDKADPTRVNQAIRALLDVSTRSSYLAITATPFANIFIDDQSTFEFVEKKRRGSTDQPRPGTVLKDLFPSDYIRVMFPPDTYLGIGTYFPDGLHPGITTDVSDCLAAIPIRHKNHHPVIELPRSLETAVIDFLIGTAVRRLRDLRTKPASMLINVSRFKSVEREVFLLVTSFLKQVVAVVLAEFARKVSSKSVLAERIGQVWKDRFSSVKDTNWDQVATKLLEIAPEFRVELVNGDTAKDRLKRRKQFSPAEREADDLVPAIVVGGDILSRGLTLEGLQVSYFVREPRTMDTLMQMGRWFGYRPNFADLVKIWMPPSTREDFAHSARVTEELRETLIDMKSRDLTPKDFGLRVRVHPERVAIVAANKGRDTEVIELGPFVWENQLVESHELTGDEGVDGDNRKAVLDLVSRLSESGPAEKSSGEFPLWQGVALETVKEFFRAFQGAPKSHLFGRGADGELPIVDAFRFAPGNDRWNVVLVSGSGDLTLLDPSLDLRMSVRNTLAKSKFDGHIQVSNRRVATSKDLIGALSVSEREAMGWDPPLTIKGRPVSDQSWTLSTIRHPILMVYFVWAKEPHDPADEECFSTVEKDLTRVAVAIAFPKMTQAEIEEATLESKVYQVNQVYWRAYNGFVEDRGDDEAPGEDEL